MNRIAVPDTHWIQYVCPELGWYSPDGHEFQTEEDQYVPI